MIPNVFPQFADFHILSRIPVFIFVASTPPILRGRVGILICYDIENQEILQSTLDLRPDVILNPVHISAGKTQPNTDLMSTARAASDLMSRKYERICREHNLCVLRCDMPRPQGAGTSQLIAPSLTDCAPHPSGCTFLTLLPRNATRFLGRPQTVPRTVLEDNTGNRFLMLRFPVHTETQRFSLTEVLSDRLHAAVASPSHCIALYKVCKLYLPQLFLCFFLFDCFFFFVSYLPTRFQRP